MVYKIDALRLVLGLSQSNYSKITNLYIIGTVSIRYYARYVKLEVVRHQNKSILQVLHIVSYTSLLTPITHVSKVGCHSGICEEKEISFAWGMLKSLVPLIAVNVALVF